MSSISQNQLSNKSAPVGLFQIRTSTNASNIAIAVAAALILLLILLPIFGSRSLIQDLIFVFYMLALAQFWNLMAGYAGLVSVGQQAFVGLGAYVLFAATNMWGLDPLLAILLAGFVALICAIPTALVVFRLSGAYFAIGTWVVAEVYRLLFAQVKELGGGTGTSLDRSVTKNMFGLDWVKQVFDVKTSAARDIEIYWVALLLAVLTIGLVYMLLRSKQGLGLAAIRDNEVAARSCGVESFKTKLMVYVVSAFGTGMIGALIYLQKARISPDASFSVLDWTAYVIFIVVIGGIGTIEGPIIGVIIFFLLQSYLADFGTWYLILLGALAIVVMLYAPRGIWGLISEKYNLHLFPVRRQLVLSEDRNKEYE